MNQEISIEQKRKALVLFSGGLDSRLAVKNLQEQKNIEVETVFFKLPFGGGCCGDIPCIINFNQRAGVKLHIIDVTEGDLFLEYLGIIRSPKFGRGVGLNPCKDCKIFMLKHAKKLADEVGASIIVTGEVVGQRPMSQVKKALNLVEEESGLVGQILRPLSGKLLAETEFERLGIIDREKLLGIEGRRRTAQVALAKRYDIEYPNPGGGCLLCEKTCAGKMTDLFSHQDVISPAEVKLINIGRHFRGKGKIIIGRNHEENQLLEVYCTECGYDLYVPDGFLGPSAIFQQADDLELVQRIVKAYSKGGEKKNVEKFLVKW